MKLAKLRKTPRKTHVIPDGIKTGCGAFIPEDAQLSRDTDVWYLHTNCYNCACRLWCCRPDRTRQMLSAAVSGFKVGTGF